MQKLDIRQWVDQNPDYRALRQAVHTILTAIAGTPNLQTSMIMKGGVLLALSYSSPRYTRDIDFSTAMKLREFNLEDFRAELEKSLIEAIERLDYGLDCRIQSCAPHPKREDASFPTVQVSVGYAYKDNFQTHRRLLAGNAPHTVRLDYSLNEPVEDTDMFEVEAGSVIHTYSLVEMIAEKFRALLQQEARNRIRRQDAYDLYFVLNDHPLRQDPATKARILDRLLEKSRIRELPVSPEAMSNPEIRRRTEKEYLTLADEIEGELPAFSEVYDLVEAFYRSLPWPKPV